MKVDPPLASVLELLTQDLDTVPEVHAEVRGNFIRIDGEVNNIAKWEYLVKVISAYEDVVKNFVKFYPGPETLKRLKETLEQADFKVQFQRLQGDPKTWPFRTVALELNKNTRAELKMYAEQSVNAIKTEVTNLITDKIAVDSVKAATSDKAFMQKLIAQLTKQLNAELR